MEELLLQYSVSEIIIFVIILAFAVKEAITFFDWIKERVGKVYNKDYESMREQQTVEEKVDALDKAFARINQQIDMLVESDKEDIKSYIVEKHHFFVYVQGWIDDYSLECLERRFAVYKQEHGNSFAAGLMNEIRALPKQPPKADEQKYSNTAKYAGGTK